MSKVLSAVENPVVQTPDVMDQYTQSMNRFKHGLEQDVWNTGTVAEKRSFIQDVFEARQAGFEIHKNTGIPQDIPGLGEDENVFDFQIEKSDLQSGLSPNLMEMKTKVSGVEGQSRYEQALNRFGDLVQSDDAHKDSGLDY